MFCLLSPLLTLTRSEAESVAREILPLTRTRYKSLGEKEGMLVTGCQGRISLTSTQAAHDSLSLAIIQQQSFVPNKQRAGTRKTLLQQIHSSSPFETRVLGCNLGSVLSKRRNYPEAGVFLKRRLIVDKNVRLFYPPVLSFHARSRTKAVVTATNILPSVERYTNVFPTEPLGQSVSKVTMVEPVMSTTSVQSMSAMTSGT